MEEVKNIEKTKGISENQESEEEDKVKVLSRYLSQICLFFFFFNWHIHALLFFLLTKG